MTSGADALRPEDSFSLAAFFLGDGLYGIDIMKIKEVIHAAPYAVRHVPHAPETIEGVIEVRGVVIPVMDLRARFGLIATEASRERAKFIVVSVDGRILALRVDRIVGEVRVERESVRPSPALLEGAVSPGERFFEGVTRVDGQLMFVLDLVGLTGLPTGGVSPAGGHAR